MGAIKNRQKNAARKVAQRNRGQVLVEFVLSLVFLMGFIIFVVQLALSFGVGNYLHYATFISARTLLAAQVDSSAQQAGAARVLSGMVGPQGNRFSVWGKGIDVGSGSQYGAIYYLTPDQFKGNPNPNEFEPPGVLHDRATSWRTGVQYNFHTKIFLGPLSKDQPGLDMTSESWLGREPSEKECMTDLSDIQNESKNMGYIDNGC